MINPTIPGVTTPLKFRRVNLDPFVNHARLWPGWMLAGLMTCWLALLLPLATAAASSPAQSLPTSIIATYKVYKAGILLGRVHERFERDGNRYKITSETRSDGPVSALIREEISYQSEGKIGPDGLVPLVFSSTRKSDSSKSFTSRFNWEAGRLVREHQERDANGRIDQETFDLPARTQDRLSSMYQFMTSTPTEQRIETMMTQGKHTDRYVYLKQGDTGITTPAGQFPSVHYIRENKSGESKVELWLAKDRNYLPVRVVFTDTKGTSLEQRLVELVIR